MSDTAVSSARIGSGTGALSMALPAWFGIFALALLLLAPPLFIMLGLAAWHEALAPMKLAASASAGLLAAGVVLCGASGNARPNTAISTMAIAGAALALTVLILAGLWADRPFLAWLTPLNAGAPDMDRSSLICTILFFLASTTLCRFAENPAGISVRNKSGFTGWVQDAAGLWASRLGFGISIFLLMSYILEDNIAGLVASSRTVPPQTLLAYTALFIGMAPARKNASLHTLGAFITIAMMMPLTALTVHFVQDYRAATLSHTLEDLTGAAKRLAEQRQEIFGNTRTLLTAVTHAPEIAAPGSACDNYLAQTVLYQPWIKSLGVVTAGGEIVCDSSQPHYKGFNIASRPYFQEAQRTRRFTLSEVTLTVTGKYHIVEAMPVDPQNSASPMIVALLDPISFGDSTVSAGLEPGVEAVFVDRHGTLIARFPGNPGAIGSNLAEKSYVRMALGKDSAIYETTGSDGAQKLFASRTLAGGAGVIILAMDRQAMIGGMDTELRNHLLLSGTILVVMLLLGYAISQVLIFSPLRRLSEFGRKLEDGDLHARLLIRPRGEIGDACRALDRMANVLNEREAHLRATRALFESVFNASRDCIYISKCRDDGQMYLAMANEAGAKAVGKSPKQITGKTYHELYGEEGGEVMATDLRRVMARGMPMDFEYHQEDVDQYWEGVHFPLRGADGKIDSIFTSLIETTARKRIDRMKSEFIATVSHELRTPLTSIAGALGLIIGGTAGQVGDKAGKLLRIAHQNAIRLVRLVNDILDIEKIEAGHMEFHIKPVELKAAVETALSSLTAFAQTYGVQVTFDDHGLKPMVSADEDRLVQVITNIVSNAVKFSPQGETVSVELKGSGRRDLIRVTVSDRGPGIPAEFQPRLFLKFCQADNSDTRAKGGTGLGLSICKEIVERLGGRILFDTVEGAGTSFHIDMPIAQADTAAKPKVIYGEAI